jgi:hypothetical protein
MLKDPNVCATGLVGRRNRLDTADTTLQLRELDQGYSQDSELLMKILAV